MLTEYIIPMAEKLCSRAKEMRKLEEEYCIEKRNNSENASDLEEQLTDVCLVWYSGSVYYRHLYVLVAFNS